jgi:hypothetical protein
MLRVLLLFALGLLIGRAGATVYKCTDGKDHIAYQATPCAAHLVEKVMPLRQRPAAAPDAAKDKPGSRSARADGPESRPARAARATPAQPPESRSKRNRSAARNGAASGRAPAHDVSAQSWQCRIGNGEVYYQHSPCPRTAIASVELRDSRTRGRSRGAAQAVPVSAMPLSRIEACRRIHAASKSGRAGHERDEDVSSYERSLGRDPCR